MSRKNGKLITCDRCKETVFFEIIKNMLIDGGYSQDNEFEKAEGWTTEYGIGDLCPECSVAYKELKNKFMNEFK